MAELFRRDVLVLGKAVFRPSGRLLRIDAHEVLAASESDLFFSKAPAPGRAEVELRELDRGRRPMNGVAAIFGNWPGDETEDQGQAALRELS